MGKWLSYLGGHSKVGSTVGFAGWKARRRPNQRGVGLAGMAPALDLNEPVRIIPREEIEAEIKERFLKRHEKRERNKAKRARPANSGTAKGDGRG